MSKYVWSICGYIYGEAMGIPDAYTDGFCPCADGVACQ